MCWSMERPWRARVWCCHIMTAFVASKALVLNADKFGCFMVVQSCLLGACLPVPSGWGFGRAQMLKVHIPRHGVETIQESEELEHAMTGLKRLEPWDNHGSVVSWYPWRCGCCQNHVVEWIGMTTQLFDPAVLNFQDLVGHQDNTLRGTQFFVSLGPDSGLEKLHMGASKNRGSPKLMVYKWKTLLNWMIWGYHYFWKYPHIEHRWRCWLRQQVGCRLDQGMSSSRGFGWLPSTLTSEPWTVKLVNMLLMCCCFMAYYSMAIYENQCSEGCLIIISYADGPGCLMIFAYMLVSLRSIIANWERGQTASGATHVEQETWFNWRGFVTRFWIAKARIWSELS